MSKTNFLCLVLAVILLIGIVSLPYDFDLSIGNNSNSGSVSDNNYTDNNGNNDNVDNNPNEDNNPGPGLKSSHKTEVYCDNCSYAFDVIINEDCISLWGEYYGSIGCYLYEITCGNCDALTNPDWVDITHLYIDADGICKAAGCGYVCDHYFTDDAVWYYIDNDERFSEIVENGIPENRSAVYNGVCTICQKTIN